MGRNQDPTPHDTLRGDFFATIPEAVLYADIGANAVRLYAVLNRHLGTNDYAWPSHAYLAGKMHCSVNTVKASIKELVDVGALTVRSRTNDSGNQISSAYYLHGSIANAETLARQKLTPGQNLMEGGSKFAYEREPVIDSQKTSSSKKFGEEETRLCALLADLIEANGSKRPTVTEKWLADMERLMRIDKRTPRQVENMIRWCQADEFWCANIMSPLKLREKYDQMRLKAVSPKPRTKEDVEALVEGAWLDFQSVLSGYEPASTIVKGLLENYTLTQLGRLQERELREIMRQSALSSKWPNTFNSTVVG